MDAHCEMLLEDFRKHQSVFERMQAIITNTVNEMLRSNSVKLLGVESRIKAEKSLAGKLELKGIKYHSLSDITDLIGVRIITFYTSDVDRVSSIMQTCFDIDWENSVDKRQTEIDRFGYMSLHYICRIPKSLYLDPSCPEINEFRFELQMRTALQHVWAVIDHDIGYKTSVDIPVEYRRRLARLCGVLELADEEFSAVHREIESYRRKVRSLVSNGKFDEVSLNADSFAEYLELDPFRRLTEKIAQITGADISEASAMPFLAPLSHLGFETLGDVERMRIKYEDDAYALSVHQLGTTDIDIVLSTISVQNLIAVFILKEGYGEKGLIDYYETLYGKRDYNQKMARRVYQDAKSINIISEPD